MKPISKSESSFETAPEGNHPALITTVADLGIQRSSYQGTEREQYRLGIAFELQDKKTKDGKPFAVFETCPYKLHDRSKLTEIVRAAFGDVPDPLHPETLLGKPVLVEVLHRSGQDGKVWANVGRVTSLPEGMETPTTETPLIVFNLDSPDAETYQKLPALFRKKIEGRVQQEETPADVDFDSDIPNF